MFVRESVLTSGTFCPYTACELCQAQELIDKFLAEEHTFDDYKQQVAIYDSLTKEIPIQLAHVVTMGLFEMHREELINTMVSQAKSLRDQLITRLTRDYQNLCKQ